MADPTGSLRVSGVVVDFGDRRVLDHVGIEMAAGEIVALQGPSGSGKSTLLRVIAGLITPTAGTIALDGTDISSTPTHRRGIGMVFQDNQLFPHLSVTDNVGFGLKMAGIPRHERTRRVVDALTLVGLDGFGDRSITSLSGGEAKRVALARSLAPRPRVLLLDEPLTGLDRDLHDALVVELRRVLRSAGTTALLVTHDLVEATAIADRTETLRESS